MRHPLLASSDKSFWHGYLDFYACHLPESITDGILEFGVFKGNSVRWLLERFPQARIFGADILPVQPEWPIDPRVQYLLVDQGDDAAVHRLISELPPLSLIIEDGSHLPEHQSRCLKYGLAAVRAGGIYILEDIHTSHPGHPLYRETFGEARGQTALSVLLGLERLLRQKLPVDDVELVALAKGSHFSIDEIRTLVQQIDSVAVYKRATLPDSCWHCGSTRFDYHAYRCECGVDLMNDADSMSIVIRKKGAPV